MARIFRDDDELGDDGGVSEEELDEVLDADNDVENDDEGKPSSSITV